jgi:hypothetical protein
LIEPPKVSIVPVRDGSSFRNLAAPARGLTLGLARWSTPSSRGDEEAFEDETRSTMQAAGPEGVTG